MQTNKRFLAEQKLYHWPGENNEAPKWSYKFSLAPIAAARTHLIDYLQHQVDFCVGQRLLGLGKVQVQIEHKSVSDLELIASARIAN